MIHARGNIIASVISFTEIHSFGTFGLNSVNEQRAGLILRNVTVLKEIVQSIDLSMILARISSSKQEFPIIMHHAMHPKQNAEEQEV